MPRRDYEVGHGKPPKRTQFKPGQSGNPKGRPRGSKNTATVVKEAMSKRITIRENGRAQSISALEAIVRVLLQNAVSGDHKAVTTLLQLQAQNESDDAMRSEVRRLEGAERDILLEMLRETDATNPRARADDDAEATP